MSSRKRYAFFALLFRMKYIRRWGLMRSVRSENVAEHSFETAIIAHALAMIGNVYFEKNYNPDRVALRAIFHDATEIYTGDLPSPIKYHSDEMRDIYKTIEKKAADKLLDSLPPELGGIYADYIHGIHGNDNDGADEYKLIKAADKLCALIKCLEETGAGNKEYTSALNFIQNTLDKEGMCELQYFYENFLPYFNKDIDEQGKL